MEKLVLTEPIELLCVTAKSFPGGIKDAFTAIGSLFPKISNRTYFGISYPDPSGAIVYKAAIEQKKEDEQQKLQMEKFIIPPGVYLTEKIEDFMDNIPLVGETFKKLLSTPQLEKFPCIEWYKNEKDVICMVKLKE